MTVVQVEGIDKQFATVKAVDGLSFEVRPREVFALLGPNGAGKTTVVRMLLGLIAPDRGRIAWRLDGVEATPSPRDVGYLPEDRGLYRDQPLLRTLNYFGALRGMSHSDAAREGRRWLERLGLGGREREKLEALSKGNQQKVQFAAAVLHRPRVAVLDEPFSGLDPLNQEAVLEIIGELREAGATIVLSAHQLNLVERLADRMLLMANGRALLQGTLADVRAAADAATTVVLETTGVGDITALAGDPDVIDARAEPGRVVLLTRRGADLGRLLTQAAARLPIQAVRSEAMTLHDVYVRAVRRASPSNEATA